MDNKIIQFRPRASKTTHAPQLAPQAPATLKGTGEISRFLLDHELTELTLTVAQAGPTAPRARY